MLMKKKEAALARRPAARDPFSLLRQMTSEFEEFFPESFSRRPFFRPPASLEKAAWFPRIDVFERDNRLVTKIDLPGLKKENVKVEITDANLVISGERESEAEETKEEFYRCEREFGSFYRAVPLPEGARAEDVRATFLDGVLEVSVPIPVKAAPQVQKVEIQEPPKVEKTAAV